MSFWVPSRILQAAIVICLAATFVVLMIVLREPWIGLTLSDDSAGDTVQINEVYSTGPVGKKAKPGDRLVAIASAASTDASIALRAGDIIEEPDVIDSYGAVRAFFAKQTQLADLLKSGAVVLYLAREAAEPAVVTLVPMPRPVTSLPSAFWVQLTTGLGSLLIGAWVVAMRPQDVPTRFFALSGAMIMLSAFPAAIYSSRELAIDG
ncbi:hypothetical protein [Methylocella sp. CPCC 101449]|uniref:hypothetical protein n=1 Tax=Methylocella sp. CPCC 101449 TaxID=2987531 RepID=UPI00288C9149|nr:hypothetical protein [Methylocella sp. CPCC 101449]MDT2021265.1 hypothetical protein [Methylocella sp. CPCC 101449]